MSEIALSKATRDELIKELKSRTSITHIQINENEGANLITKSGKLALSGKTHVFVVPDNEKEQA